jgi:DNA transformation protein
MAVSAAFREQVGELLAFMPGLRIKRMFGGAGVWSDDLIFALVIGDELYLKADEETRPAFEAEGCGPWLYERAGVVRDMGYSRTPDIVWDDPDEARRWAAMAVAASARRHQSKVRPRRR